MFAILPLLVVGALHVACMPTNSQLNDKVIHLPTGKYTGIHDANTSVTTYYAIPYAFADRFEPSAPIAEKPGISPDATIDASKHGAGCVNFNLPPPYNSGFSALLGTQPVKPQSENCFTVDVYVPDGGHGDDLPVLVYTPGGGFLVGASFIYDMTPMVQRGLEMGEPFIAVVINYRLGPLGFLNPSTWGEDINLGLLDQVQALKWVKEYIHAFGGSADKVTISGESAGGESALHQFLWTHDDLFRSAWLMSIPSSGVPFLSTEPGYKNQLVKSYAEACGCPKGESIEAAVECLRTTSVSVMVNQSAAWEGSMTGLGGNYVRRNVFEEVRSNLWPKVPVMVSTTRDEGTALAFGFHPNSTEATEQFTGIFVSGGGLTGRNASNFVQQMLEAYPNNPALGCPFNGQSTEYGAGSQYKRVAAIATDGTFVEAWYEYLESFSARTSTYGLMWEEPLPGLPPAFGVIHGSDLYYYFPSLGGKGTDPRMLGYGDLVRTIQTAVVNFVNHGDPNGCSGHGKAEGYTWPQYDAKKEITYMNASRLAFIGSPPHRPGFDVLHEYLRPGPF